MLSGKAPHLSKCRDSKVAPARDLGGPYQGRLGYFPPTRLAFTASQPVTMSRNRGNAHRQATGLPPDKMGLY